MGSWRLPSAWRWLVTVIIPVRAMILVEEPVTVTVKRDLRAIVTLLRDARPVPSAVPLMSVLAPHVTMVRLLSASIPRLDMVIVIANTCNVDTCYQAGRKTRYN